MHLHRAVPYPWSSVLLFSCSSLASNIKVLYFEKMMQIKSLYMKEFIAFPLFSFKGTTLVLQWFLFI